MAAPLVTLASGWALWPVFELRGAGFPVEALDPLQAGRAVLALEIERARSAEVSAVREQVMDLLHLRRRAGAPAGAMNKLMDKVRKLHGDLEVQSRIALEAETRLKAQIANQNHKS